MLSSTVSMPLWPRVAGPIAVALFLYMGGLVLNDWADRHEDAKERPDRPIPSGRIKASSALVSAVLLLLAGIAVSCTVSPQCIVVALALAALVVFYDLAAKRIPLIGSIVMGSCRGLSVLLGWSASGCSMPSGFVWMAAAVITAYIVAVSLIAVGETKGGPVGPRRWAVPLVVVASVYVSQYTGASATGLVVRIVVLVYALMYSVQLGKALAPQHCAAAVGGLIRGLILVQLVLCAGFGSKGTTCALALIGLHVVAVVLSRRFYAS